MSARRYSLLGKKLSNFVPPRTWNSTTDITISFQGTFKCIVEFMEWYISWICMYGHALGTTRLREVPSKTILNLKQDGNPICHNWAVHHFISRIPNSFNQSKRLFGRERNNNNKFYNRGYLDCCFPWQVGVFTKFLVKSSQKLSGERLDAQNTEKNWASDK